MKKTTLLLLFALVFSCYSYGQASKSAGAKTAVTKSARSTQRSDSILSRVDSLIQVTNMWLEQIELDNSLKNRYKMYPTDNIYTLFQLDTKTGMIEQVQWSVSVSTIAYCSQNKKCVSLHLKY